MDEDIKNHIQKLAKSNSIWWTSHGAMRMLKRSISRAEVVACIINGECIESYDEDKPLPSYLIHGNVNGRNLHVVVGVDSDTIHVITSYEPSNKVFKNDFKTRRNQNVC